MSPRAHLQTTTLPLKAATARHPRGMAGVFSRSSTLTDLDVAGVALYNISKFIDPLAGRSRPRAPARQEARPPAKVPPRIENAIRGHLSTGNGTLKVPALVGCGSDTVRRVRRKMAE